MAKTRRQRRLEHPDMPKKGVRDKARLPLEMRLAASVMGRMGGNADHKSRGLETASKEKKQMVSLAGVLAKKEKKLGLKRPKEKENAKTEREVAG